MKKYIALVIVLLTGCCQQQPIVCDKQVVVKITEQRYRTTYVELSNGRIASFYTPTLKPGNTIDVCSFSYEDTK